MIKKQYHYMFYWKLSAIFWISICGYFYESSQVDLKINSVITYLFFLNKNRKYIIVPHLNITSYKVSLCISLLISFYKILIKAVTVFGETNFLSNLSKRFRKQQYHNRLWPVQKLFKINKRRETWTKCRLLIKN